jgi:folate-binding protein YgfZ
MQRDLEPQRSAIENSALVRAMPELATLEVTGEERLSWLAGLVTQDIGGLKSGAGAYAVSVAKNGRLQAELWVLVSDERILVATQRTVRDELFEAMDRYLIMEDAELVVPEQEYAWWLAHGPLAADVVAAAKAAGAEAALAHLGELPTAIVAAPTTTTHNLAEILTNVPGALLATPDAWKRIRIERMLPRFGVDFDVKCFPQEACLEHLAVSFSKGCYVGQEAVFMLEKRGHVKKRLVRLVLDDAVEIESGAAIQTPEGEAVGTVTSAIAGEGDTYAMGLVRYKQTLSGTELVVAGHPAKVSCLAVREGGPRC